MALTAALVWEWRPGAGSNNNGGGFDAAYAGTDYSQQNAAQLTPTDLACTVGSTTLTSAVGGFTAAMKGNVIYIRSGTNFVVGSYLITNYTNTNTVTIDRTASSGVNATGGSGNVGGARAIFTDAVLEETIAGNKHWVMAGTMTLTESLSIAKAGTNAAPIVVEGYNAARGDKPTGTNRPLIAAAAYTTTVGNYWLVYHLRMTTTTAAGLAGGTETAFVNCKVYNSSNSGSPVAITLGTAGIAIDCEAQSDYGTGISKGIYGKTLYCFIHDCNQGAGTRTGIVSAGYGSIVGCIIDACTTGVAITHYDTLVGNTIDGATTGVSAGNGVGMVWYNNIISNCTTGASQSGLNPSNVIDWNDFYADTTDRSNLNAGPNDFDTDPAYTNKAGDDFSRTGTPSDGFGMRLGVG